MPNKDRLYRVLTNDGEAFFGTINHLNRLPKEYRDSVLGQIDTLAQGKEAKGVKLPLHELEKAGWMTEEVAQQFVGHAPEPVKNKDEDAPKEHTLRPPAASPSLPSPKTWQPTTMCDICPLKKVADKVIEKTLEKL